MDRFSPSVFSRIDTEYADMRIVHSLVERLTIQNGEVQNMLTGYEAGAGVRVLKRGNWGFSSTTDVSSSGITTAVERAHNACPPGTGDVHLAEVSPVTWVRKALSQRTENAFELVKDLEGVLHFSPFIKRGSVHVRFHDVTKQFLSSEGSHIEENQILVVLDLRAVAHRGGKVSESHFSTVLTSIESHLERLKEAASDTVRSAVGGLDAGIPPNGQFPVILGPSLASIFVHEAVGHRMEADEVMEPHALMRERRGSMITHPSLTVVDSGNDMKWYEFDDEGVQKRDTVLIEKGRVREVLHDRRTAHHFGCEPTGNSRASSYETEPLPRMTNIKAVEGDRSFEELVEQCSDGLFLDGFVGGAALPDGTFRFAAREGYLIEHGACTSPLRMSTISGSTLDALRCVAGIGKEVKMHYSECMKRGQSIVVGLGSPALFISPLRVGG